MNVDKNRHILNKILIFVMLYLFFYINEGSEDNILIYILLWDAIPVFEKRLEQQYFINRNCNFQNCFVTDNRSFFTDVIYFDVIIFNSVQVSFNRPKFVCPPTRSSQQKYIFMSSEPPAKCPIASYYNGFFNYTFTYKLDSDVTLRFFVVRNKTGNTVIAPKRGVKWIDVDDMEPIGEKIKLKLQSKNTAAAWLVSNCHTTGNREELVVRLRNELENFNLSMDITGLCADLHTSPCNNWYEGLACRRWIETNHYFYLAFENSLCEDYVTEKILRATKHFAVPIVFGGADYSRFLPKGSYIYANELEPEQLASTMSDIIRDKNKYYEFFKWHGYYSIHEHSESADTDEICALCAFLNDKKYQYKSNVYTNITWYWMH